MGVHLNDNQWDSMLELIGYLRHQLLENADSDDTGEYMQLVREIDNLLESITVTDITFELDEDDDDEQ